MNKYDRFNEQPYGDPNESREFRTPLNIYNDPYS